MKKKTVRKKTKKGEVAKKKAVAKKRTAKTEAVKRIVARKDGERLSHIALEVLDSMVSESLDAASSVIEGVREVDVGGEISQELLASCLHIDRTFKTLKKQVDDMKSALKAHKDSEGSFAYGRIAITFPISTRRSFGWKPHALELAERISKIDGTKFESKEYVEKCQDGVTPSETVGVELVESEG